MNDTINQVGAGAPAPMNPQFTTVVIRDAKDPIQLGNLLLGGVISAAATGNLVEEQFQREADAPAAPVVQAEQEPAVYWILFDATGSVPYIKKSLGDGFLAFFDNEEDAKRAKRKHHGTDYKRVEYFRAPPAHPDAGVLVEALKSMTCAYRMAIQAGHARITALGGDCDSVERMLADFPEYGKAIAMCKAYRAALAGKGGVQ